MKFNIFVVDPEVSKLKLIAGFFLIARVENDRAENDRAENDRAENDRAENDSGSGLKMIAGQG